MTVTMLEEYPLTAAWWVGLMPLIALSLPAVPVMGISGVLGIVELVEGE